MRLRPARLVELAIATAFYAGICYMLFDGACEYFKAEGWEGR